MSMYYLIGGAPRAGKSTALQRLLEKKPMLSASTDAIRAIGKGLLTPEQNPRLFTTTRGEFDSDENIRFMQEETKEAIEYKVGECEETWKMLVDFMGYYQQDGREAAVEGTAVLPSKLSTLDVPFKAVFITHLGDQTEMILKHAMENENDWLHSYDESFLRAFSKFNQHWNQYYADEATKYGYPVIDTSSMPFEAAINSAVDVLLNPS